MLDEAFEGELPSGGEALEEQFGPRVPGATVVAQRARTGIGSQRRERSRDGFVGVSPIGHDLDT